MNKTDFCRKLGHIICAVGLATSSGIALAQSEADSDMASDTSSNNGDWEFTLAPLFLWGVSINGDATIGDATAPLALDFKDDILENLEAVFTVTDAGSEKRLWEKKLKIDLTRKEMSLQESLPLINEKTAKIFIRDCFSKGRSKRR